MLFKAGESLVEAVMSGDTRAGPAKGCSTTVCFTVGGQTGKANTGISELLGINVATDRIGDCDMIMVGG